MVLRVKATQTRFPTNSLYIPMDNTTLHSISSVCHPWGSSHRSAGEAICFDSKLRVVARDCGRTLAPKNKQNLHCIRRPPGDFLPLFANAG